MSKLIAVDGATLVQERPSILCTITEIGIPSIKNKITGKGILKDGYQILVSNVTYIAVGATIPDTTPYTVGFISTAIKPKADGDLVLLENDISETITAYPKIPGTPPTPYSISFVIEITKAGQILVTAK